MQRRALGLLGIIVVLTALVLTLLGPDDGTDPSALAGDDGAAAEVEIATDEPGPAGDGVVASGARTDSDATDPDRRAIGGAGDAAATSDGPLWSDLLRPVDALSLAPVADAHVHLVLQSGELVEQSLDSVLDSALLGRTLIAALDGPNHAPRPLDIEAAANVKNGPLDVQLWPTVSVRLELVEHHALQPFAIRLEVLAADTNGSRGNAVALRDAGMRLATALAPATTSADRLRDANLVLGHCGQLGLLELAGPPEIGLAASRPAEVISSFPHEITDLPALGSILLGPRAESYVEFTAPDGAVWSRLGGAALELPREGSIAIDVRYLGHGSVIGQLPTPFTESEIATGPWLDVEEWDPNDWSIADEAGTFAFEGVLPGDHQLLATWEDGAGIERRATRNFTIVAGKEVDLGLLAPNAGTTIVLEPVVVVDGEVDRTQLNGALDGTSFRYVLCSAPAFVTTLDAMDPQHLVNLRESDRVMTQYYELTEIAFDSPATSIGEGENEGLDPVTVSGLTGTRFGLLVLNTLLPDAVSGLYLDPVWRFEPVFDAIGTETRRIELHLTTASRLSITAHVSVPPSTAEQRLWGFAWNHDTGRYDVANFASPTPENLAAGVPWEATGIARLTPGTWTVYVFCASGSIDEDSVFTRQLDFGQVASATVTCELGDAPNVVLRLAPGAEVVGPPVAFADDGAPPAKWVQVYPTDLGPSAADFWYGFESYDKTSGVTTIRASTLLPNTEYRVKGTDRTFHTGSGGTTVELAR